MLPYTLECLCYKYLRRPKNKYIRNTSLSTSTLMVFRWTREKRAVHVTTEPLFVFLGCIWQDLFPGLALHLVILNCRLIIAMYLKLDH
jgi:hypothetical protein